LGLREAKGGFGGNCPQGVFCMLNLVKLVIHGISTRTTGVQKEL
jgi:hypothetical protein